MKLVLIEPFRPRKSPEHIAESIGAKLVLFPASVGANDKVKDYFNLVDHDVAEIVSVLKEAK